MGDHRLTLETNGVSRLTLKIANMSPATLQVGIRRHASHAPQDRTADALLRLRAAGRQDQIQQMGGAEGNIGHRRLLAAMAPAAKG